MTGHLAQVCFRLGEICNRGIEGPDLAKSRRQGIAHDELVVGFETLFSKSASPLLTVYLPLVLEKIC